MRSNERAHQSRSSSTGDLRRRSQARSTKSAEGMLVDLVELAIATHDVERERLIEPRRRIERAANLRARETAELGERRSRVGAALLADESLGELRDALGLIADAFEIGEHLDDREHEPKIGMAGCRRRGCTRSARRSRARPR